jgi:hypothetical protein
MCLSHEEQHGQVILARVQRDEDHDEVNPISTLWPLLARSQVGCTNNCLLSLRQGVNEEYVCWKGNTHQWQDRPNDDILVIVRS